MSDDGTCTADELRAMGFDPDNVPDMPAMPWRSLGPRDLADMARLTVEAAEMFLREGEAMPCVLLTDLVEMISVDEVPHSWRMRACRLVAQLTN